MNMPNLYNYNYNLKSKIATTKLKKALQANLEHLRRRPTVGNNTHTHTYALTSTHSHLRTQTHLYTHTHTGTQTHFKANKEIICTKFVRNRNAMK